MLLPGFFAKLCFNIERSGSFVKTMELSAKGSVTDSVKGSFLGILITWIITISNCFPLRFFHRGLRIGLLSAEIFLSFLTIPPCFCQFVQFVNNVPFFRSLLRFMPVPTFTILKGQFPWQKQCSKPKISTRFSSFCCQIKLLVWSDPASQFLPNILYSHANKKSVEFY